MTGDSQVALPKALKRDELRFVKIEREEKHPFEKNWVEEKNYRFDDPELRGHVRKGGNYGVVCGIGGLVVIDADDERVEEAVEEHLPDTFTVLSGGGGRHYYFFAPDMDGPIRLRGSGNAGDLGDVQHDGKQVVGPGSLHPNGERYRVENDAPIAEVKAEEIKFALREFTLKNGEAEGGKVRRESPEVPITDVVDTSGLTRSGDELYGPHPLHGSETGRNFWINPEKNVWHCFRHDSGGGPLLWLAVKWGFLSCEDALPGALVDGQTFHKVVEKADEEGLIDAGEYLDGEDRTVRTTVKVGAEPVEIVINDLYVRGNSTRGSIHAHIHGNHRFDEDRKLSNQNLKQFVNQTAELESLGEAEKGELFRGLADLKEEAREQAAKEASGLQDGLEKEELDVPESEVKDYLKENPLSKLCGWTDDVHVGDGALKIISRFSAYSRELIDYPINIWPIGGSRGGETHLLETIYRTIPAQHALKFDSCSPKSMYYFCHAYGEDALDGKIVFFNEAEASEEAAVLLRGLTDPTKEENRLLSVDEQSLLDILIQGLPVTWFTSVDPIEDPQLSNRFLFCNPDESTEHKRNITEHQMDNVQDGVLQPLKKVEFPVLKAAFQHVVENTKHLDVKVPFRWTWHHKENPQLQQFFSALVYVSAKIHYLDREIVNGTILATLDDYYLAKLIFDAAERQTRSGVKEKDLEIYGHVPESREKSKTRSGVAEEAQVSTNVARHSLERLVDAGLVNKEKSSNAWEYWKSEKKVAKVAVSLCQDSLKPKSVKEFLDERFEPSENISYIEGEGSENNPFTFHKANILQALEMDEEDVKRLFEDYPGEKDEVAAFAASKPEKEGAKRSDGDHQKPEGAEEDGESSPEGRAHTSSVPEIRDSSFYRQGDRSQKDTIDEMLEVLEEVEGKKIQVSDLRERAKAEGIDEFFPTFLEKAKKEWGIISIGDDRKVEVLL